MKNKPSRKINKKSPQTIKCYSSFRRVTRYRESILQKANKQFYSLLQLNKYQQQQQSNDNDQVEENDKKQKIMKILKIVACEGSMKRVTFDQSYIQVIQFQKWIQPPQEPLISDQFQQEIHQQQSDDQDWKIDKKKKNSQNKVRKNKIKVNRNNLVNK